MSLGTKEGNKYFEGEYKNGKVISSLNISYHDNGEKKAESRFKNGEKHGKWVKWNEDGRKNKRSFISRRRSGFFC